ncbi:MAG TPA: hypothetical protein VIL46_09395, partial [Gemmataceae bacterium]
ARSTPHPSPPPLWGRGSAVRLGAPAALQGPVVRAQNDGLIVPPPPAPPPSEAAGAFPPPAPAEGPASPVTLAPPAEARAVSGLTPAPMSREDEERYNAGMVETVDTFMPDPSTWVKEPRPRRESRFGPFEGLFHRPGVEPVAGRGWLESDHGFDFFISPVTNPFLAEDPRALTEVRPIFMYQLIPGSNHLYGAGDIEWFGAQARVALTERLSFVLHKLGGIRIAPGEGSLLDDEVGFSEVWLGGKYTFWRDEMINLLVTGGLQFQIPAGPDTVFQDTGELSLVPYVSVAKNLWKTDWGSFNLMNTFGWSFATDDLRSNYLYNSLHIDFDLMNWGRVYPLLELNWFHYTRDGAARPLLGFEGADLANTGAAVEGRDYLFIAPGARFKLTEALQLGVAAEFPIIGTRDLNEFRLTADLIWRY